MSVRAIVCFECDVCTHYAVGHQGSLHKACQDISRVVLVVGDT